MLPGMLENHYAEEGSRALRAASTQRAVVPRERRFVDQDMGQAYLVGGSRDDAPDGAWACMTHMPYKAPRAPRPAPGDVAPRAPSPPLRRVRAGAAAREARGGRSRWENDENCAALPRGESLSAARLKPAEHRRESPFATADFSTAAATRPRSRGRHRHELAERSNEPARRGAAAPRRTRGRTSPSSRAAASAGRATAARAHVRGAGGLGVRDRQPAETFHLRTRSTKRVGITPASHEHNEQYYRTARRGARHGGGASSVGFSDGGGGGLSAALSPGKAGKKAVASSSAEWCESTYGEPLTRDALEHAAVKLVEEARADEPPAAPAPRAPPRAPPPARAAPRRPSPPRVARDFVACDGGKNSILGNRSIKTTRPPGGGSSINLGWD
ncbi:hypothetical protein JL720_3164 [Aureococcus anophagefferens]|nr:hypothetical protein JL720_3164 [Aureococcus anophagefferens]